MAAPQRSLRISRPAMENINDDDDRISRLPDEMIHHIFSFLDTRSIIKSGCLSRRWRNTWKSHPKLNFEITPSPHQASGSQVRKFAHHFLSKRDDVIDLSTVNFQSNSICLPILREMVIYAMSHRTRKLKIDFLGAKRTRRGGFDSSLFRSRHLEHLFLSIDFELKISPHLTWDFPALTTLSVKHATFMLNVPEYEANKTIDLFSQFPNLKTLALDDCYLCNIDIFVIKSTELETLSLINIRHLNCKFVISTPKLSSFTYNGMPQFSLSAKDLVSIKTVNFQTVYYHMFVRDKPEFTEMMIETFKQLSKEKSLTLNFDTLKVLSLFPDVRERQNCPFTSLQSLTLLSRQLPLSATMYDDVINYFKRSSPDLKLHIEFDRTQWYIEFW